VTVAEVLGEAAGRLRAAGIETARLDAEVLLRHILNLDRIGLFLRMPEQVADTERLALDTLIIRRIAGEPVAYLTGEREFMGLAFAVGPGVLVPRPETEVLVEWALSWVAERHAATVVDVGTGSGAIALALAAHLPASWQGTIIGAELSSISLRYASANRERLGLSKRVHLVRGDLVSWCRGPIDLLLANLPYLRPEQLNNNPDLRAEPSLALTGGDDGLAAIRRLVADVPRVLGGQGALGLEIDPSQAEAVRLLAAAATPTATVGILPDLAGLPRHVVAIPPAHIS
jgi:release factor glutamine methyltransferase